MHGREAILDVGCGDGKISTQLSPSVKEVSVLGIDLSEDIIQLASEQYPSQNYPNLSSMQMNAADIQLTKKFDVAFSNAVLHWVIKGNMSTEKKIDINEYYSKCCILKEMAKNKIAGSSGCRIDWASVLPVITTLRQGRDHSHTVERLKAFFSCF